MGLLFIYTVNATFQGGPPAAIKVVGQLTSGEALQKLFGGGLFGHLENFHLGIWHGEGKSLEQF